MFKPLIAAFTMAAVVPLSLPAQAQTPAGTGHAKHAADIAEPGPQRDD